MSGAVPTVAATVIAGGVGEWIGHPPRRAAA